MFTLHNGDALQFAKTLQAGSLDCIVTDPPYGTTKISWDSVPDLSDMWAGLQSACKQSAVMAFFSSQPFTTDLIASNRHQFRYELIWRKSMTNGFFDANKKPMKVHENILIFCQIGPRGKDNAKQTTYNPQMMPGSPYKKAQKATRSVHYNPSSSDYVNDNKGERYPVSVVEFSHGNNESQHPTQKPIGLIDWLIRTYSNPGDTVFDPFMGSGTTGAACVILGRNFIGCEIDPIYFAIAEKRIQLAALQQNFFTPSNIASTGQVATNEPPSEGTSATCR